MSQLSDHRAPAPQDHISQDYADARAAVPGHHFPDPWKVAQHLAAGRTRAELVARRDRMAGTVGTVTVEHWDNDAAYRKNPGDATYAAFEASRAKLAGVQVEHEAWTRAVLYAK